MKNLNKLLLSAISLLFSVLVTGQNTVADIDPVEEVLLMRDASTTLVDTDTNQLQSVSLNNSIFIEQIGFYNEVSVSAESEQSNISIRQNGISNQIVLDLDAFTTSQNIQQNGKNNYYAEYFNNSILEVKRNIVQNGEGQQLIIHGVNQLSENLQLKMQGDSQTIIIRNFN